MKGATVVWLLAVACLAGAAGVWWGLGWGLLVAGILLGLSLLVLWDEQEPPEPRRRQDGGSFPTLSAPPPMWTSTTTRPEEKKND